jgi:hypothetical protein
MGARHPGQTERTSVNVRALIFPRALSTFTSLLHTTLYSTFTCICTFTLPSLVNRYIYKGTLYYVVPTQYPLGSACPPIYINLEPPDDFRAFYPCHKRELISGEKPLDCCGTAEVSSCIGMKNSACIVQARTLTGEAGMISLKCLRATPCWTGTSVSITPGLLLALVFL